MHTVYGSALSVKHIPFEIFGEQQGFYKIVHLLSPFLAKKDSRNGNMVKICACLELHCRVVPVSERVVGNPPVYWVQLRQPNSDKDFAAVLVEEGLAQYSSGVIFFKLNPS
jgi:hypothetical protein